MADQSPGAETLEEVMGRYIVVLVMGFCLGAWMYKSKPCEQVEPVQTVQVVKPALPVKREVAVLPPVAKVVTTDAPGMQAPAQEEVKEVPQEEEVVYPEHHWVEKGVGDLTTEENAMIKTYIEQCKVTCQDMLPVDLKDQFEIHDAGLIEDRSCGCVIEDQKYPDKSPILATADVYGWTGKAFGKNRGKK